MRTEESYIVTLLVCGFLPSFLAEIPLLGVGDWAGIEWTLLVYFAGVLAVQSFCAAGVIRSRQRQLAVVAAPPPAPRRNALRVRPSADEYERARRYDEGRRAVAAMITREQSKDPVPPWEG